MTPGLVAFLMGLAVFFAIYGVLAPKTPVRSEDEDEFRLSTAPAPESNSPFERLVRPALRNFLPQTPLAAKLAGSRGDKIAELILQAGNPWRITPVEYVGLRALGTLAGGTIGLIMYILKIPGELPPVPLVAGMAFIGYWIPRWWHKRTRSVRIEQARKELPEVLDLLRITMSAGRNFVPALGDVVTRMPPGLMKQELKRVTDDLAAGRPLAASLTMLARRVPAEEVEGFVSAIIQTERLGSDVGKTLENQSAAVRSAYEGRLEKQIASLETLIIFPVLVGFMPAILAIIIAPALSQIGAVLG